ncbi:unnamed protein product [Urochloa humidicola]
MRPELGYLTFGLSRKGYSSLPPLPEVRAANRLRAEQEKARKDTAKETQARKQKRKDDHEKENRKRAREGQSLLPTPESTPEPDDDDSSGGEEFLMVPAGGASSSGIVSPLPYMMEEEEVKPAAADATLDEPAPSMAQARGATSLSLGGMASSRGASGSGGAQPPSASRKRKLHVITR